MPKRLSADSHLLRPDFSFGVATSSFQIEGKAGERLPCIWDTFCEQPGNISDGSNGLIACDHIERLEEDLDLLSWLGVDAYRFSLSWPRIITADGVINSEGMAFYDRLLDGLAKRGIEAFVTLYHWDLPQWLEDQGGWLSRETAFAFQDYTALVVKVLGDRVRSWATLNEPWCSAWLGHGMGKHAPGKSSLPGYRQAAHHLLLAHGLGMEVLQSQAADALNGIVVNVSPCHAASDSPADQSAAQQANDFHYQWFLQPLLESRYPELMDRLKPHERPPVKSGDLETIGAKLDYLGINYYTRQRYQSGGPLGFQEVPPQGETTDMGWEIYPQGLEEVLLDLNARYHLPPVYICENGIALEENEESQALNDHQRSEYFMAHLQALDRAVRLGIDIRGYFYWSLMDNFEWAEGYAKRFGLIRVDFETQKRTPKASAEFFRKFLVARDSTGVMDQSGTANLA